MTLSLIIVVGLTAGALVAAVLVWRRFVGPTAAGTPLRIAQNSLFPVATSLLNRLMDLGFVIVLLKALGPDGVGQYTEAVVLVGFFDIFVNFGLGTLLTREVAHSPQEAGRYFWNSLALRLALWLASLPALLAVIGPLATTLGVTPSIGAALTLFVLGLVPGQVAGAASALLSAFEQMHAPAAVTVLTTVLRVGLGLLVISAGASFVALAGVSLVVNVVTMVVLVACAWRLIDRPVWAGLPRLVARQLHESYPLMINNLLNSVFFRIDVVVLQALTAAPIVGWYTTAYRFIDGLNVIPSSFVLALFPLLSRQAAASPERLNSTVATASRLLLALALPICVGTVILAEPIVLLVADQRYLPHAAIALSVLIWFLPLSFVNGLLQYVLIAIGRQRSVTGAFVLGAGFNLIANLALIPHYGYLAASAVTVLSEAVLLIPFVHALRGRVALPPLGQLLWRPAVASMAMGALLYPLRPVGLPLLLLGALVYGVIMLFLGAVGPQERAFLEAFRRR